LQIFMIRWLSNLAILCQNLTIVDIV
ncbi:unnamed protein product, partial [Larinioides sclopetarius]